MALISMADAVAGQVALSAEYNKLIDNIEYLYARLPKTLSTAMAAGTQTVTTTAADLTGVSRTLTVPEANTQLTIRGYFDVEATNAGDIFIGTCQVDGSNQSGEAHFADVGRATVALEWVVSVSAGSHTVKLRVQKVNNGGSMTVNGPNHSKLVVVGNGIS